MSNRKEMVILVPLKKRFNGFLFLSQRFLFTNVFFPFLFTVSPLQLLLWWHKFYTFGLIKPFKLGVVCLSFCVYVKI